MHFSYFRIITRTLLVGAFVLVGTVACKADLDLPGVSPDTAQKFVSHTFGFAFTPPPGCSVKMSGESEYFQLEGKDDPQFGGHVQDLNRFFQDFNYAGRLAEGKVSFRSVAEAMTVEMYKGEGDRASATGRVDSVHAFKSPAHLPVVIFYMTQRFRIYEGASVDTSGKEDEHSFVAWADMSHEGKYFALVLDPWESRFAPEKAMTRCMSIVNSLTLIPFKGNK